MVEQQAFQAILQEYDEERVLRLGLLQIKLCAVLVYGLEILIWSFNGFLSETFNTTLRSEILSNQMEVWNNQSGGRFYKRSVSIWGLLPNFIAENTPV